MGGGYPNLRSRMGGTPSQVRMGIPCQQNGGTPIGTGWGILNQDLVGYPHQDWMGYPLHHREIGRQSSCAAGVLPLAFMQEDFLVLCDDSLREVRLNPHEYTLKQTLENLKK